MLHVLWRVLERYPVLQFLTTSRSDVYGMILMCYISNVLLNLEHKILLMYALIADHRRGILELPQG